MGDGYYDGPGPGYGPGYGPPPPQAVAALLLLVLLVVLVLAIAGMAYRQGVAAARRRTELERAKAGAVIFHAIRGPLNVALLATGERVFAPARTLMETVDLYIGPLLAWSGGLGAVEKLRKAMNTTTKEVKKVEHHPPAAPAHPPAVPAAAPGAPTMIFTAPIAVSGGTGAGLNIAKPVAEAAAAHAAHAPGHGAPGHGAPGHGAPGHGHGDHGHEKIEKVDLTLKEQARNVREALETLSDFWQEDRVKDLVMKAQAALLVSEPIGTVTERAQERAAFFRRGGPPPASPVAKAAREANRGFPLFKL